MTETSPGARPIRVLVADDSPTVRQLLAAIIAGEPGLQVVGEAANGVQAVERTRALRPDVVTMDIHMPVMDGFEATRQIMNEAPTPIVVVSGTVDANEVQVSLDAIRAGALTVLGKPASPVAPDFEERARALIRTVRLMAQVKVVRRWPDRAGGARGGGLARDHPMPVGRRVQAIAVATSTGGPAALNRILADLPAPFPAPILVVQHIARGFVDGLARWLATSTRLRVKVAEDGESPEPGTVYLAPDGRHLGLSEGRVALSEGAAIDGFRPSGTWLFRSVAASHGANAAGVILTGMGYDGVEGLADLRRRGGYVIAQDERTSVVFGMPGAAVGAGVVDDTLPLGSIAPRLIELVQG
ncbi:MAG TPA: chemotaxis-specific protein-glutamate methyltransferase CheB [Planctomycetota bacterium]|nr:chemotaxis-specific protein-glutamate methyltransferase CheB [Planctomycetota bacterium]